MFTAVIESTITPGAITFAGEQRVVSPAGSLFYNAFDAGLNALYWKTAVAGGGGVAAISEAGDTRLGTGTTANGFSTLESVPSFQPSSPGWLQISFPNNVPFPYIANTYFFMGVGTQGATPTAAAPLTDGAGFEVALGGKMFAVCYSGGQRNIIADLSRTGNNTQPLDATAHMYTLYYRGDHITWTIDGPDAVVAQTFSGAPGPIINTLPLKLMAIAGPIAPLSNGQLQCNAAFVGDTTNHASQIADASLLWQKAAVDASGNLSVKLSAGTQVLGHVITDTGSTTAIDGVVSAQGPIASNNPNGYNPLKQGGVFNTTQPTVTNGQIVDLQSTNRGAAIVATGADAFFITSTACKATAIAAGAAGPTVIKASAGFFYGILVTTVGAGTPQVFDNASTTAGTIVGALSASVAVGDYNAPSGGVGVSSGITVSGGATNPAMTIFWL